MEAQLDKIPVIGTTFIKEPYWLRRLIASVDYPVEEFLILNNEGTGKYDEELAEIARQSHKYIDKIKVCNLPGNIGVAAAWNLIIKSKLMAKYWIIVNDDVSFGFGLLKRFAEQAKRPELDFICAKPGPVFPFNFDLFLIKSKGVQKYGLFDENLYPAYCEDMDYAMKFISSPGTYVVDLELEYYHGHSTEYSEGGSQSSKHDPVFKKKVFDAHMKNQEYLDKKWTKAWRWGEPKLQDDVSLEYNLELNREKYLGF